MKYKIGILIITWLLIVGKISSEELFVAMLEQPQCKENTDLMVRVLFIKKNEEWIALDIRNVEESYDFSKVQWITAFDGRNIGQVRTIDPKTEITPEWTYSRDKLLKMQKATKIVSVLNKSEEFWGWCNAPKFRPLVLVSKPNFKDPAKWKPFSPVKDTKDQLFPEFKKITGGVERCRNKEDSNLVPCDYQAQDLQLFKSYENLLGQKLISIGLDAKMFNCDLMMDSEWIPKWFLIDQKIRYIGNELSLIDAGDYDNDGKSELIFWHSGYNEDGYTLFYNNFNDRVDFYWKYH
jgi:hypothetical protein